LGAVVVAWVGLVSRNQGTVSVTILDIYFTS
jgi:hypothetical protein